MCMNIYTHCYRFGLVFPLEEKKSIEIVSGGVLGGVTDEECDEIVIACGVEKKKNDAWKHVSFLN